MLAFGYIDNDDIILLYFAYIFGKRLFKRTCKPVQNLILTLCLYMIFVLFLFLPFISVPPSLLSDRFR